MRLRKRFAALVLTLLLFCAMSVAAYAHETPDTSKTGSISVEMTYEDSSVAGGTLTLYRVGSVAEDNGNYNFILNEKFAGSGVSLENIQSAQLAKDLAVYAGDHRIDGTTRKIGVNGEVSFTNLEQGLYLLVQGEAASGYNKAAPFLVSIPMNENGTYFYDVDASPKVELEKEPEPTPTTPVIPSKPTEPTLPQTGQLNWPIPVLAVLGLCLFAAGWGLRFGKKEGAYAE